MESQLRNVGAARALFRAGVQWQPRDQGNWDAWIGLENDMEAIDRVQQLVQYRMMAMQQQPVPESFSTLPRGAEGGTVMSTVRAGACFVCGSRAIALCQFVQKALCVLVRHCAVEL